MQYIQEDTIAAIATAQGAGGIGIVRISGPNALSAAKAITKKKDIKPRYAEFSKFYDEKNIIDEGVVLFFPGPNSFTGEDVVELQGHGGQIVLDMVLKQTLKQGARIALPGEFTQRAFLNNKIDLTQAEAIADLINAGTAESARAAVNSLQGDFSTQISALLRSLIELRVYIEAAMDFPEEEIDFLADGKVLEQTVSLRKKLELILRKAKDGAILQAGASVCLTGRPNSGKSSLLNALGGKKTAIVTSIPGTTRDLIKEKINVAGIALNFVDTAGLRDKPEDEVEKQGIDLAINAFSQADITLLVVDISELKEKNVDNYVDNFFKKHKREGKLIVVLNKIDLKNQEIKHFESGKYDLVSISAKEGKNVDNLCEKIKKILGYQEAGTGVVTARARHVRALEASLEHLCLGLNSLEINNTGEILAEELKLVQNYLSEITGEFSSDDLLGEIFSSFCIGK